MRIEYICEITLEDRDIRLLAANGKEIEHPVPLVKTIIKVTSEVREQLVPVDPDRGRPFRVSASEER